MVGPHFKTVPRGKQLMLRVLRREPLMAGGQGCFQPNPTCGAPVGERRIEVRYGTTLSFFYPDQLKLNKSEDDWGDDTDELWHFLAPNAASPKSDCNSNGGDTPCQPPAPFARPFQWFGYMTEGGNKKGAAKLGVKSFVERLQPNIYSEAEPGSYDTEHTLFGVHDSAYKCANPAANGVCPLPPFVTGSGGGGHHVLYRDVADYDDADDDAHLYFCMAHEFVEPEDPSKPAIDGCKTAGNGHKAVWGE